MSYFHISVDNQIGPVGALVSGVDLSQPLSADVIQEIHAAWLRHHVLFFRDQELSPSAQARFASYFGELDQYPFMKPVDDSAYVIPIVKEAGATINFGGDWHTDTSYKSCPPKATLLFAVEVPEQGGDTLFADATAAIAGARRTAAHNAAARSRHSSLCWSAVVQPRTRYPSC